MGFIFILRESFNKTIENDKQQERIINKILNLKFSTIITVKEASFDITDYNYCKNNICLCIRWDVFFKQITEWTKVHGMDVTTVGFISGSEIKSRVKELPLLEISQDVFFSIYHLGIFGMFFALIGFGSQKVFSCSLYFCALIYSVSWFCLFCFVLGCFVVWSSLVIFEFF